MKNEIVTEWTAALRSGNYQQTQNKLRIGNSYCCLGLLCELVREPAELHMEARTDVYKYYGDEVYTYAGEAGVLPPEARNYVQMTSLDGVINLNGMGLDFSNRYDELDIAEEAGRGDERFSLAELNDAGFAFPQIADLIDYFKDEL